MIISHQHRYIFIHCRKVAGSALKVYLARYLGPDDIRIGATEECLANGISLNRRFYKDLLNRKSLGYLSKKVWTSPKRYREHLNRAHKIAYEASFPDQAATPRATDIKQFDHAAWRDYFKFCFVRNPYERAVSDYLWRIRSGKREASFHDFLTAIKNRDFAGGLAPVNYDNWEMYTINNEVSVDFIGRYENLAADFTTVCRRIGLPDTGNLPVAKKNRKAYNYRDWYGPAERALVEELFRNEIEYFDYRF